MEESRRFTFKQLILHFTGLRNLYNNFAELMDLEERLGVRSTFFIPTVFFSLSEVEDYLRSLVRGGWEVGLHFVVEGSQLRSLLKMGREVLEETASVKVLGVRSHNLVVDEYVLKMYDEEGFEYDSSLRMEEAGGSSLFKPSWASRLVEVPIGVMDADLFGRLHLSEDRAFKYVVDKMRRAEGRGEKVFTLLFHQESFSMRGGRMYAKLLEEVVSRWEAKPLGKIVEEWRNGRLG